MANETPRFRLTTLDAPNDTLAYRSHKFGTADRELLDRLVTQIVENHHHNGAAPVGADAPPPAPQLIVNPTGGSIPANVAVSYRYAIVDLDHESIGSLAATIYTPPPVLPPTNGPVLERAQGVLMTGDYLYAVSAYTYEPTRETPASMAMRITLIDITGVNVTLPSLPSGATGFNIYRKGPTDSDLRYLVSVDTTVATYHDNGSVDRAPLWELPTANTTSSSNSITVRPGVSPAYGATWKVFRTYDPSTWDDTLLVWGADVEIIDTGWAPQTGSPLGGGTALGSPPKINLATETTGAAPSAMAPTTELIEFTFAGPVHPGLGAWQWVNDFDRARVLDFRANLGRYGMPGSQPVKVALERSRVGATSWRRYIDYSDTTIVSSIPVGASVGGVAAVAGYEGSLLYPGYSLRPVILQSGGSPQSDTNLVVSVQLAVKHGLGAPPEEEEPLQAEQIATFPSPGFQRTHRWPAPQDGTLTNMTVTTFDSGVDWEIQLKVLVNDTVVYTSDPLSVTNGAVAFSPEFAVPFFKDDSVQFEVTSLDDPVNSTSGFIIGATAAGAETWYPIDDVTWYPVNVTGNPYEFTFIGGTYNGTQFPSESRVEVDLPPGLQPGDMVVVGIRSHWEPAADSTVKMSYVHDWGLSAVTEIPLDQYGTPGIDPDYLWLRALRYQPDATKISVELHLGVVDRLDASVVAFRGPERIYNASFLFSQTGSASYSTYDGLGDGVGIWLHLAMDLPLDIDASPGAWYVKAPGGGEPLGVSFFGAGVSATSPNVTWTSADPWPIAAQVIALLGAT